MTRNRVRMLLAALVFLFIAVGAAQSFLAPGSWTESLSGAERIVARGDDAAAPVAELDPLREVLLYYANGMVHVARRYTDVDLHGEAATLLDRVVRVRRAFLGPSHPELLSALKLRAEARRRAEPLP